MTRIPVFRTIGRAYGFTFGNLGTIIGLVWLPLIIQTVGSYVISVRYMGAIQSFLSKGDFSALSGIAGPAYLFFFASLFLTAVISAPVLRQALGLRQGGAYIHFWPDANAFRLFAANFALMVMLIAILILVWIAVVVLIVALAFGVKEAGAQPVAGVSAKVLLVLGICAVLAVVLGAFIFVLFRLSFLVAPIAIAERKIDLVRAWSLTRGNFWRIFFISLAISLPVFAVTWAVEWALFGTVGVTPTYLVPTQPGADLVARSMAAQFQTLQKQMPVMIGITLFLAPMRLGLDLGAASFAYRELVPSGASNPPAAEEPQSLADGPNELAPAPAAS